MLNLKVELGERTYPIFIGEDTLAQLGEILKLYQLADKVVVVCDETVHQHYGKALLDGLAGSVEVMETIVLAAGERSKSMPTVEHILTRMLQKQCDRDVAVVAFGGGVVGDVAGFAASIFKRGVPYVQVPTTLLAQVDSSVGGKTGINHALGKNLIGTFYQPRLVWIDLSLLTTLPQREIRCGLGEVVKYGIIRDAALFETLARNFQDVLSLSPTLLPDIVKRSCEIKAEVVAQDERESGLRMILNFGHTVGHAVEAALGYKHIAHGEAVLVGMLAESRMALEAGLLPQAEFDHIRQLIDRFQLTGRLKRLSAGKVRDFMSSDKKTHRGRLRFVLPRRIGEVEIIDGLDETTIASGLQFMLSA